jgi:hypothetical protein
MPLHQQQQHSHSHRWRQRRRAHGHQPAVAWLVCPPNTWATSRHINCARLRLAQLHTAAILPSSNLAHYWHLNLQLLAAAMSSMVLVVVYL